MMSAFALARNSITPRSLKPRSIFQSTTRMEAGGPSGQRGGAKLPISIFSIAFIHDNALDADAFSGPLTVPRDQHERFPRSCIRTQGDPPPLHGAKSSRSLHAPFHPSGASIFSPFL